MQSKSKEEKIEVNVTYLKCERSCSRYMKEGGSKNASAPSIYKFNMVDPPILDSQWVDAEDATISWADKLRFPDEGKAWKGEYGRHLYGKKRVRVQLHTMQGTF